MTEKQMGFTMASPLVVPRIEHGKRPTVLALVERLLLPSGPVQRRLRQAQASLDTAMRRLGVSGDTRR